MTPPITGWWLCLHLARAGTTIIMLIYRCPAWPAVVRDRHELVWDLDAEAARLSQADQIGTMTLSRLLGSVVEAPSCRPTPAAPQPIANTVVSHLHPSVAR